MKTTSRFKLACLFVGFVGLAACDGYKAGLGELSSSQGSGGATAITDTAGFKAFSTTLYSWSQTQGCATCHGSSTTPLFAQADPVKSYQVAVGNLPGSAIKIIDFNLPDSSVLVEKSGDLHCGTNACSNPANKDTMKALLRQWAQAELGGGVQPPPPPVTNVKFVTASVPLPATIPTIMQATVAVVRFPMKDLRPAFPGTANAIFEVEVQMVNPTNYRFINPKIVGNTAAVNVTGIRLFIRPATGSGMGSEDVNHASDWAAINSAAPISTLPATLPTTPLTGTKLTALPIISAQQSTAVPAADVLTIGFVNLQ